MNRGGCEANAVNVSKAELSNYVKHSSAGFTEKWETPFTSDGEILMAGPGLESGIRAEGAHSPGGRKRPREEGNWW